MDVTTLLYLVKGLDFKIGEGMFIFEALTLMEGSPVGHFLVVHRTLSPITILYSQRSIRLRFLRRKSSLSSRFCTIGLALWIGYRENGNH